MMKGLIAAGGRATRLRPITHTMNKHLIPLANRPMIYYPLAKIGATGIKDVCIVINEGDTELKKVVGDGSHFGVRITYREQVGGPKGVAHVIKVAEDFLDGDPFLFHLGDNVISEDLSPLIEKFEKEQLNGLLVIAKVPDPGRFGVPEIVKGKIIRVIEKPQNPISPFAVTGIYLYDKHVFSALEHLKPSASRGEYEISEVHTWLIQKGYAIGHSEVAGMWKDTGKPEDLLEANQMLLNYITPSTIGAIIDKEVILQGKVEIGKGTRVSGRTTIRGPVSIGNNCLISDSYIGPYTSIGSRAEITSLEIENSIVFEEAKMSSTARIVESIIGFGSRVVSSANKLPSGHRLIVGSSSLVEL